MKKSKNMGRQEQQCESIFPHDTQNPTCIFESGVSTYTAVGEAGPLIPSHSTISTPVYAKPVQFATFFLSQVHGSSELMTGKSCQDIQKYSIHIRQ